MAVQKCGASRGGAVATWGFALVIVAVAMVTKSTDRGSAALRFMRLTVLVNRFHLGHAGTLPGQASDLAVDGRGNLFIADNFVGARPPDGRCQVRERVAATDAIKIIAGALPTGPHGGMPAQRIELSNCQRIAVDAADTVYLISTRVPYGRHPLQLFRIVARSGTVRAIAGCVHCYGFHVRRPATESSVDSVTDLAVDRGGNVLLTDSYTGAIWKVTLDGMAQRVAANVCRLRGNLRYVCPELIAPTADDIIYFRDSDERVEAFNPATGRVSIVAGGGSCHSRVSALCGNGIPATRAKLDGPRDIATDARGDLLIADDVVQRVDRKSGRIEILAGNGKFPSLQRRYRMGQTLPPLTTALEPMGLAIGPDGTIFIANNGDGAVLKLGPISPPRRSPERCSHRRRTGRDSRSCAPGSHRRRVSRDRR
jgi:hypothetical protein